MKKILAVWLLATVLALLPFSTVLADQTTQNVTVTATGSFISIANAPSSEALGTIEPSSTTWAIGSAPSFPLADGNCTFTITNTSSIPTNITINTNDWTGGSGWTCSDTATPGADTFGMKAAASGCATEDDMVIVKKTASFNQLKGNLAANTNFKWEFKFLAPTSFSDGVEKSGTVTLTAAAA